MFQPIRMKARHTGDGRIEFFWAAENTRGGRMQSAYCLRCGPYESGWVETAEQHVTLRLQAKAGETLTWSLILKDDLGNVSDQAAATFLYAHTDSFFGKWIAASESRESVPTYFEKKFHAEEGLQKAFLFVSAAGLFHAELNGEKVGENVLAPNLSHFAKRRFYQMLPLNAVPGENDLVVALADGWRRNLWDGLSNDQREMVTFMGEPELCAFIKLVYADREEMIGTDESWLSGEGPVTFAHLFNGESCDLSKKAVFNQVPRVIVDERPIPQYDYLEPIREHETFLPRSVVRMEDGRYILDFGQNMQGYLCLRLDERQSKGTRITLRHAEELDENEGLYTDVLRTAKATDKVIAPGGKAVWKPVFTYHGFRYAEVTGWQGELRKEDIQAVFIYTDIAKASSFECGSALLNAIQKNIVMTERSNLIGIATDCPQRDERMGWMNDATVRFVETPYNFSVDSLFPKIIDDLKDEQGADGAITCTAPLVYGNRPADPVCSSFLVAGLENYLHNGDTETIRAAYEAFRGWSECLEAHADNHIVNYSYYGDWAGPAYACEANDGARSIASDGRLFSTGYHYYNACTLSRFAALLGDEEEADRQAVRAKAIREAFIGKWFDEKTLTISNNSEGEIAFALWLDILPESARCAMAKKLRDDLVARDYMFTTGNLSTVYMLEELARYGYVDEAYHLMTREEYPGYGYMIQNAATTVWERFELKKNPGMNSHNHPMYGSVGSWFYRTLAGLVPKEGGWKRFVFKPVMPKKLQYVSASVETPKGDIVAKWQKKYDKTYVMLSVPFGCEAEVVLPGVKETVGVGLHRYIIDEIKE